MNIYDLTQLRHLYANLKTEVCDTAQAKRLADGLLAPIIERLEQAATTEAGTTTEAASVAEQAAPKAAPGERCANCGDSKDLHNGLRCVNGKEKSYWKAPQQEAQEPFGYVNIRTGQFFKDVEQSRKNNQGHWRTVFTAPQPAPAPLSDEDVKDAARLEFAMQHGMPMECSGVYRYHGFVEAGWHPTKVAAIDAAIAAQGGKP